MFRLLPALAAALLALAPSSGHADDDTAELSFASDRYVAGSDIEIGAQTDGDLFAASEDLALEEPVLGATHLAARRLTIDAETGTLYAFAYEIDLDAAVTGAASLFAAEVDMDAEIGGNLRLFAREAEVRGAVAGSALIAAQELDLNAPVAGDLMLAVESVEFGDDAVVTGQVIVYVEEGEDPVDIPARVADAARVEVRSIEAMEDRPGGFADMRQTARRAAVTGFIVSVLTVAALAAAALAIAPAHVAQWREQALAAPGRSFVAGFLLISTIAGAGLVLALTIIGIPLLFAALILAGLVGYAGYVMGAYILGVGLWVRFGNEIPTDILPKAGLALFGAFVIGVVALIPFLGWLVVLALALTGAGAIATVVRERRANASEV
jgi:hypothetical protein